MLFIPFGKVSVLFTVENHHGDNPVNVIDCHRVRVFSSPEEIKKTKRARTRFSRSLSYFCQSRKNIYLQTNQNKTKHNLHYFYLRHVCATDTRPTPTNTEDGIDIALAAAVLCLCVCACVRAHVCMFVCACARV
ncbi:unnamed protein product [Aphis gossypii]|uniref:Uncharacterized protein n=1 Tax=Aphis gossypii TaxID=80765 RepID=A0A9P0IYR3_APHGO|nr:unnamed protein product [Aphis gossypii]